MIIRKIRGAFIAGALGLLACSNRADDAPGSHLVLPDAPLAPGPIAAAPALREGLQLTYQTLTSALPGNLEQVVASMPGTLDDPNSGTTYFAKERKRYGAAGPQQTTVVRIDGDKIIGSVETFLASSPGHPIGAPPQLVTRFSVVQSVGENTLVSGQWLTLPQLNQMAKTPPQGCKVGRGPFKAGDHTFDAITFSGHFTSAECFVVYDAETGFLIHRGVISQGPPSTDVLPGVTPRGDVLMRFMDLVSVRDLKVPWAHEPMPQWAAQLKGLHMEGTTSSKGSGGGIRLPPFPRRLDFSVVDRGDGWIHTVASMTASNHPVTNKLDDVSGPAEFGGLWAGPQALATLQLNQVLDDNPVTRMKTVVTYVDDRSIIISEANETGQSDWKYDKTTGMLTARRIIQRVQVPMVRTDTEEERLVSKE